MISISHSKPMPQVPDTLWGEGGGQLVAGKALTQQGKKKKILSSKSSHLVEEKRCACSSHRKQTIGVKRRNFTQRESSVGRTGGNEDSWNRHSEIYPIFSFPVEFSVVVDLLGGGRRVSPTLSENRLCKPHECHKTPQDGSPLGHRM